MGPAGTVLGWRQASLRAGRRCVGSGGGAGPAPADGRGGRLRDVGGEKKNNGQASVCDAPARLKTK